MNKAQLLIHALLGMAGAQQPVPPMRSASQGRSRPTNHRRARAKKAHNEYSGAKLARKAVLGEVGMRGPVSGLQAWAMRRARS